MNDGSTQKSSDLVPGGGASLLAWRGARELKQHVRERLEACDTLLKSILASEGPRGPENTLIPLDDLRRLLGNLWNVVGLLRNVHPESELRAAAEEAEKDIARFANELDLNRELYEAVSRCEIATLDATGRRLVAHLLRDFHRAGVDRDEEVRRKVRELREELIGLGQEFTRNILNDVRRITLEGTTELDGLPEDYVARLAAAKDGKITLTTEYPDYNPFMTYARSANRRQDLYREFRRRAYPLNLEVLDQMRRKRHELATLLGYRSWAAYACEDKMIRTPEAIADFIDRVTEAATPRAQREYEILLERKKRDQPEAIEVHDWEKAFYEELIKTERYQVDSKEVRNYFGYPAVKAGILALTEDLFGIGFRPVPDAPRWHPDIEVLDVVEEGSTVGRFYLDMHPREGKFKHAAMFPLVAGVKGKSIPEAVLVCNFPDPRTSSGPALLEHDDVVTFFHEFGHLVHHLFARDQDWVQFSGVATEWDFIEVPSQLYEEWAWDYEVLRRFASHQSSGEVIPQELVERMRSARYFGRALWVRHQMFYASVSLKCYGQDPGKVDMSALIRRVQNRYSKFRFVDGTYFQASFGHLDDYSALYYTYMWSLVIEKDFFQEFKEHGAMDRATAARYRREVLAPGGSADAGDLVRRFLGRDYTFAAFASWLESAP
jgi:thimet oligopeptidase